ncbi:MAG: helix-turn-helix domain-containing protein [bacterium]|nr:helix-turn-helix domain-containing protein [bacterium]
MEKIVFNVEEMSQILEVKPLTIYRSVNKGKIPAVKIGKNILFPKDVILQWLKTKAWEGYKGKTDVVEAKEKPFVLKEFPTFNLGKIYEDKITREEIYGDYLSDRF